MAIISSLTQNYYIKIRFQDWITYETESNHNHQTFPNKMSCFMTYTKFSIEMSVASWWEMRSATTNTNIARSQSYLYYFLCTLASTCTDYSIVRIYGSTITCTCTCSSKLSLYPKSELFRRYKYKYMTHKNRRMILLESLKWPLAVSTIGNSLVQLSTLGTYTKYGQYLYLLQESTLREGIQRMESWFYWCFCIWLWLVAGW